MVVALQIWVPDLSLVQGMGIAILPAVASLFGIADGFAIFFGGTSLLIMVGVVLDTLQQIESHLLSRHYDGLMKSGKIKGRSSTFGMAG